jgi:hypothetical protein
MRRAGALKSMLSKPLECGKSAFDQQVRLVTGSSGLRVGQAIGKSKVGKHLTASLMAVHSSFQSYQ